MKLGYYHRRYSSREVINVTRENENREIMIKKKSLWSTDGSVIEGGNCALDWCQKTSRNKG